MKLRGVVLVLAGLIGGIPSLRAQSFTWNGKTALPGHNNVSAGTNWIGGSAPSGLGGETANFGDLTSGPAFLAGDTQQFVDVNSVFGLRHLNFTGSNRPEYFFDGTGIFILTGDVTANAGRVSGANVAIDSIAVVLSDFFNATHVIDVTGMALSISSNISQLGGAARLDLKGDGTINLSGSNSWSGGTQAFDTVLVNVDSDNGLGTGILSFDSASFAEVQFNTSAPVIHGLKSDSIDAELYLYSGAVLTINQGVDTTFAGTITDGVSPGGIVKTGAGRLTMTGYSDYLGTTTINGGTLEASGSGYLGYNTITVNSGGTLAVTNGAWLSNTVDVNSGGTLSGTGHVYNAYINAGGRLAPGGAGCPIGDLSFDDLTLGTDGTLEWHAKSPSSFDTISVFNASTLTIDATPANPFVLRLFSLDASDLPGIATGFTLDQTTQFTVFSTSGISGFNPASFIIDSSMFQTDGGPDNLFEISQVGSDLILTFTPVPEPSTYVLLAGGAGLLVWLRRRRSLRS